MVARKKRKPRKKHRPRAFREVDRVSVSYAQARAMNPKPAWLRQVEERVEARRLEQENAKPEVHHAQATMIPLLELAISMHHLRWKQSRTPMSWVFERAREAAQTVAEKGDVLQFGGKGCAEAFNALAEGLAILAFYPRGVKFCGHHWKANPDDVLVRDAPETGEW